MSDRLIALGGQVSGGSGATSTPWLDQYAEFFEAKTGMKPFPTSLGIALDATWQAPEGGLRLELPNGVTVACVPCEVDRVKGLIVLTNDDKRSRTAIEVVTPVDLRHSLSLQDGDGIEVVVSRNDAKNVVADRRLAVTATLAIAVVAIGALFGILVALSSLRVAATVLVVTTVVVFGTLWRARFWRQASIFPDSVPLRWPTWPARRR